VIEQANTLNALDCAMPVIRADLKVCEDVCRNQNGGRIDNLRNIQKNFMSLSLFQRKAIWYQLRSLFIVNFQNVSRTYE
jgi:hypothetical protein